MLLNGAIMWFVCELRPEEALRSYGNSKVPVILYQGLERAANTQTILFPFLFIIIFKVINLHVITSAVRNGTITLSLSHLYFNFNLLLVTWSFDFFCCLTGCIVHALLHVLV